VILNQIAFCAAARRESMASACSHVSLIFGAVSNVQNCTPHNAGAAHVTKAATKTKTKSAQAPAMPSADDLAERQAINKIGSNDVFVRAAKLSDATALIKLNEEFRENMLRWQQEDDDAEYPALDFDDVEFILNEEDEQNLIVLCEKPAGGRRQARIIGYSYAYDEPWAVSDDDNQGKGKGKGKGKGRAGEAKQSGENNSLYIAEVLCPAHSCRARSRVVRARQFVFQPV
jgi:hypothetical protein